MGATRRIPVIKNRVTLATRKKSFPMVHIGIIALVFALMIFVVWLKVQTNLNLAEIRKLEQELSRNLVENEKLQAEVVKLSSFGRIHKIAAEQLGLEFLPREKIIELPKTDNL